MKDQKLPKGWTDQRVNEVLRHYEGQTEEESVKEDESALSEPKSDEVMRAYLIHFGGTSVGTQFALATKAVEKLQAAELKALYQEVISLQTNPKSKAS